MMTLQNDPPSLESVSEYEDQYKSYGKSIRKLIVECLQKDPAKRPTASELLKHPFIKKAKDRRYLMQTLLPNTPSFAERSKRALDAKRACFDSGNDGGSGSWVWPQDEVNQLAIQQQQQQQQQDELERQNQQREQSRQTQSADDERIVNNNATSTTPERASVLANEAGHQDVRCELSCTSSIQSSSAATTTDGLASSTSMTKSSHDLLEESQSLNYSVANEQSDTKRGQLQLEQRQQQIQRSKSCDESSTTTTASNLLNGANSGMISQSSVDFSKNS
jgi:serine/threonine protein kinase